MPYGDFEDLPREQLLIKCNVIYHLILLQIQNMIDISMDLLQWISDLLIKIRCYFRHTGTGIKFENQQLAEKNHKPIIKKFRKRKVHFSFMDNIWGTYPEDMQIISK